MAPGFDRIVEQPVAGAIPVPPSAGLVVTEGNYLLLDEPALARPCASSWTRCGTCASTSPCGSSGWSPGTCGSARHRTRPGRGSQRVDQPNAVLVEAAAAPRRPGARPHRLGGAIVPTFGTPTA